MRNILLILALVLTTKAFSQTTYKLMADVVVRDSDNELSVERRELKNLLSPEKFEGKYFKIVKGTENEAIVNDGSLDARKAANVYYHLERARDYFVSIGGKQDYQAVIRIEIINVMHRKYHFQNPDIVDKTTGKKNRKYNNAETIYKGEGNSTFGIPSWGNEIWFRPPKKIKISDKAKKQFKETLRRSIPKNSSVNADLLTFSGIEAVLAQDMEEALKDSAETILTNYVRDSAIRWAVPEVAGLIISFQRAFLDTAYIPGVIYHEYTHLVMADAIPPVVNNPLIEGVADFFAIKVAKKSQIADDLGDFGGNFKERTTESEIAFEEEFNEKLGTDFMLSLFFEMDRKVTELEGDSTYFSKRLFEMRKLLTVDSNISEDLGDLIWLTFPKYRRLLVSMMAKRGI